MKLPYVLLALLTSGLAAHAANSYLRVSLNNGKVECYSLGDTPAVTFSGENMLIATPKVSSSYPRADVQAVDFTPVPARSEIVTADSEVVYTYDGNVFACEGAVIDVYDLSGAVVASQTDSVSLESLITGVYVVKVNNQSIKICR